MTSDPPSDVDGPALNKLLALLRGHTGHDFTHYRPAMLARRAARRVQVTGCANLAGYLEHARADPDELARLSRDVMIGVTSFFRDRDAFELVRSVIVPRLFQSDPADPLRIWVPGCATGEEAYSWGMLLLEQGEPARPIQIFASDLDDGSLEEARRGRYPDTIAADVSSERLARFFTRDGDHYQIGKELRELVLFTPHDVLRDAPFSRLDVVSCRNLLIYLDHEMREHVLRTAHFALRPGGVLVLGSSEHADTSDGLFHPLDPTQRIYLRQHKASPVRPMPPKLRRTPASARELQTPGERHQRMLERLAPPSVLVDPRLEVIHISERAHRYLHAAPGEPSRDLFRMVLPELRRELRGAVIAARSTPGTATSCSTHAQLDGEPRMIRIGVQAESSRGHVLVWFEETATRAVAVESPDEPALRQLEDELWQTRDRLRSTVEQYETLVEQMHASNEELLSINEELRAAGDEIEASREETDSANAELGIVNRELQLRIREATVAKSDLVNLLESSDVGVIFLDRELRIHRFTQRACEIFNILDSDLGRPLADLKQKVDYPELHAHARGVLASLTPVEREVQVGNHGHQRVRIRPYRSLDDQIAGVVITFLDITSARRILDLAERATDAGTWQLDARMRLQMSARCHELHGTAPESSPLEPAGWARHVAPAERDAVLAAVAAALQGGDLDIEFRIQCPENGERWLRMVGRRAEAASVLAGLTLDVTARRLA